MQNHAKEAKFFGGEEGFLTECLLELKRSFTNGMRNLDISDI